MTDPTDAGLYRLLTWLSPACPIGAFSYSHGLEWAVEAGLVHDRATLIAWLSDVLEHGGGWSDAVLLARGQDAVTRGDDGAWRDLCELAAALPSAAELLLETSAIGEAFARVALTCWSDEADRLTVLLTPVDGTPAPTYPLAVAATAAVHGIARLPTLIAYAQAFAANLVSAAVRLIPLGQTDGQKAIAALEPIVQDVARRSALTGIDELGTAALMVDWCAMRHETQYTRLFRS